ncbi:DegT/DnrJ/EryC1/StrS family aminotransferase [Imperialibacter roseus]|uniref:DegT/DnrJ/EryC1/StrS family aminotransferase n=1 Tax=Imperialibacter roseus TaxID=1324217 RepID=A0ABZ0IMN5_9BACT|nr:DegT/DnrJ/EryC1/StrS family aminotransferase [Imperialibacter roseus]WOK06298.1 DegT/DnrJ/EryC1/StrS family aminotransferase [Imperialibacter roseus]
MIPVTKPFLPPIEEYQSLIADVWQRQWLTNNGPLVNELELQLKTKLDIPHLLYVTNGTIALQLAIKALNLRGEIITTPFSYVATCSSIIWEGCTPIFVDIDSKNFNINPDLIEASITPKTTAILATHVFGNACDIEAIGRIADKHNLKVIYDAAHCFGTTYKGQSIFKFGDISTTSFHATKLFHTVEGGAVFTKDSDLLKKLAFLRNFGHHGPKEFEEVGINGKNSELHAAMGLLNLNYLDDILQKRKQQSLHYIEKLRHSVIQFPTLNKDTKYNYAYFPVVFQSEAQTLKVIQDLEANRISPRRYFYPSLNTVELFGRSSCPESELIASKVLCLPLYHTLTLTDVDYICRIILRTINN